MTAADRCAGAVRTLELNALAAQERGDTFSWLMYAAAALAAGELSVALICPDSDDFDRRDGQ